MVFIRLDPRIVVAMHPLLGDLPAPRPILWGDLLALEDAAGTFAQCILYPGGEVEPAADDLGGLCCAQDRATIQGRKLNVGKAVGQGLGLFSTSVGQAVSMRLVPEWGRVMKTISYEVPP